MIFFTIPGPAGVLAGASIVGGLTCLLVLGKLALTHMEVRDALRAILPEQKAKRTEREVECSEQIALLSRSVAILELNAQDVDGATRSGLTRSLRLQAIQMLQSGMPPERAASILGIGEREMRVIAGVSDRTSIKMFDH